MRTSKKYRRWVVISDNTKFGSKGDRVVSISLGTDEGGGRYDLFNVDNGDLFQGISTIQRGTALEEIEDEKPKFVDRLRDEAKQHGMTVEEYGNKLLDDAMAKHLQSCSKCA